MKRTMSHVAARIVAALASSTYVCTRRGAVIRDRSIQEMKGTIRGARRRPQATRNRQLLQRTLHIARPALILLGLAVGFVAATSSAAAEPAGPCFDFRQRVVDPLKPSIPLLPGGDNHVFGTYPTGVDWAAGRGVLEMPIEAAYARLLDHRNVKDMKRTTLSTTVVARPDYMAFHLVDVVVTVRALFFKINVPWTEAWAYSLVEGTRQAPRRIVVSYQKVAGTGHIQRQCGSYVLQARDDATTDLSLYEEVKADRRSARDTRDMHRGILRNLRDPRQAAGGAAGTAQPGGAAVARERNR
jgi:hypothetical protein